MRGEVEKNNNKTLKKQTTGKYSCYLRITKGTVGSDIKTLTI